MIALMAVCAVAFVAGAVVLAAMAAIDGENR